MFCWKIGGCCVVQHPCALLAHLQNKPHGEPPFFIQLATISHLLVRHSLGIPLILVAHDCRASKCTASIPEGVRTERMLMRQYDFCVDACIRRGPCLILRSEERLHLLMSQLDWGYSRVCCEVVCNIHSIRSCIPVSRYRRLNCPLMLLDLSI